MLLRGVQGVTVNGKPLPLCTDFRVLPTGPSQLALAILMDHFEGSELLASAHYERFTTEITDKFKIDSEWYLTTMEIIEWLSSRIDNYHH